MRRKLLLKTLLLLFALIAGSSSTWADTWEETALADLTSTDVFVIVGDNEGTGYDRRELFVDAKDISNNDLTQEQYEAALYQRGIEKLDENMLSTSLECVVTN